MAAILGADMILVKGSSSGVGGTAIAAITSVGVSINNTAVEYTNNDSNQARQLLDKPGVKTVDFSVSGVTDDRVMLAAAMAAADVVDEYMLTYTDGADIYGNFFIESYSDTGETQGPVTFECTLKSAGAITYQAGA